MRRREAAPDPMHQLAQFVGTDLRFELRCQRAQHTAPLWRNLALQQVIENWDHVFRELAAASIRTTARDGRLNDKRVAENRALRAARLLLPACLVCCAHSERS